MKRSNLKSSSGVSCNSHKIPKITQFYDLKQGHEESPSLLESRWECFICGISTPNNSHWINMHIDKCLVSSNSAKQSDEKPLIPPTSIAASSKVTATTSNKPPYNKLNHDVVRHVDASIHGPNHIISMHDIITVNAIDGIILIRNFITTSEETSICQYLDNDNENPWKYSSFNGHCHTKGYGVVTQFGLPTETRLVRMNEVSRGEREFPLYMMFLIDRLKAIIFLYPQLFPECMYKFEPNECNANQYIKTRKDHLTFHYDDRFLSGEVLMNLSMMSASIMTYIDRHHHEVDVHLPSRCLQLVTGIARYQHRHGIKEENIFGNMRISLTFRQAGDSKKGVVGQPQNSNRSMDEFVVIASSIDEACAQHQSI